MLSTSVVNLSEENRIVMVGKDMGPLKGLLISTEKNDDSFECHTFPIVGDDWQVRTDIFNDSFNVEEETIGIKNGTIDNLKLQSILCNYYDTEDIQRILFSLDVNSLKLPDYHIDSNFSIKVDFTLSENNGYVNVYFEKCDMLNFSEFLTFVPEKYWKYGIRYKSSVICLQDAIAKRILALSNYIGRAIYISVDNINTESTGSLCPFCYKDRNLFLSSIEKYVEKFQKELDLPFHRRMFNFMR